MTVHFLFFIANLLLAGAVLRIAEIKMSDTKFGAALSFLY